MRTSHSIDTSGVELGADIEALGERLARHVHELWLERRTGDGWTRGPTRDDTRREHPGIVPYDELAESEKEVDRQVARGVLKAIVALGYDLRPTR